MRPMVLLALAILTSSSAAANGRKQLFQKVVDRVDIERFLGPWYVIALMLVERGYRAEDIELMPQIR